MKKIVTIGGGNGHSSILKGFYDYLYKGQTHRSAPTSHGREKDFQITAIVSMSDDGRTTGLLMREMQDKLGVHMPPPGDIRKCSLALSSSPFKDELKEIFETILDFEGEIIEYSLGEMLEKIIKPSPPSPSPSGRGGEASEDLPQTSVFGYKKSPEYVKELAKKFRKEGTEVEDIMWELLRNRQLFDLKFRRQHTFGRYIADFYSNDIRLVIELDGKIHENQKEYDEIRDDIISKYGVKVLRIKNEEILNDLEGIISKISTYVPFLNSPLPLGEGQGGEGGKEKESDIPQYLQNFDPSFLNYTLPLKSPIKGHKFGNILMATLYYNFGDYNKMVNFLGGLLQTKGKVLPVTTDEAYIFAELGNSELVESQDKISNVADYKAKIDNINLLRNSKKAKLSDEVRDAILEADYLIIGPGDLYTSIYANFLIDDFRELVIEVPSKKIYILNSNNKKGETTDYEEIDFIDFIQKELEGTLNLLVANSRPPKLTEDEKKKFLSDISVKGGRYLFIEEKKKKEIKKKYPKLEFLLGEYVDKKTLYKNNMNLIEDLVEYMSLAK